MDLVRGYYRALNHADLDAIGELYDPDCIVEHVWVDGRDVIEGCAGVRARYVQDFTQFTGALAAGHRVDVTRVAGIETGWGWVRSEWVRAVESLADGSHRYAVGYSHFWIERGRIRRHRSIATEIASLTFAAARPESERRYPSRPLVGVGGVAFSDDGRVLLVKRRHEPLAHQWSLPGGMLELGETLEAAVAREMLEETGLVVTPGAVVEVFDRILLDDTGRVRYHFVLIDYLCTVRGGTLAASSDVEAAEFVDPGLLADYRVAEKAKDVIARAIEMRLAGAR